MTEFTLSLGSNVGDKAENLRRAIERFGTEPDISIITVSPFYRSAPWGKTDQDWFVNACAIGRTRLSPLELLGRCQRIEADQGRVRGVRWGPRVIDVDILIYGDVELETETLTLPHRRLFDRAFVLVPLAAIDSTRVIKGRRVADALAALPDGGADVERMDHMPAMVLETAIALNPMEERP
ncbi:2-amino-4-hydroxy-6-hydroxymethyldihydropteridine diphosphokinase [Aquabacter sp. CN5-332]|uniref:2-amino-4-hydroxy-6- hydroxymethyldihydropteridine diphosphokinase n=1 Tax=Aquabacter sp. CN5-332 TaxID=3156608 RepID=UPI0032B32D82